MFHGSRTSRHETLSSFRGSDARVPIASLLLSKQSWSKNPDQPQELHGTESLTTDMARAHQAGLTKWYINTIIIAKSTTQFTDNLCYLTHDILLRLSARSLAYSSTLATNSLHDLYLLRYSIGRTCTSHRHLTRSCAENDTDIFTVPPSPQYPLRGLPKQES